jgi:hypothetical protein
VVGRDEPHWIAEPAPHPSTPAVIPNTMEHHQNKLIEWYWYRYRYWYFTLTPFGISHANWASVSLTHLFVFVSSVAQMPSSLSLSFLDLPFKVRLKIYTYSGLLRDCPVIVGFPRRSTIAWWPKDERLAAASCLLVVWREK